MNTIWIPCEYQMNTLSNVMNHDSQFWFRLRFQVMWLQRWLWWTQWPLQNPGHQRGHAPCDISLPKERENGHLIFQSHGLEVHFCFGFSVVFGSWGHFWEYFVPFAHQERQMKILKMWASDISISKLLKDPSNLMLRGWKSRDSSRITLRVLASWGPSKESKRSTDNKFCWKNCMSPIK